MPEFGEGWKEKLGAAFSWSKKEKPEEDLNKLSEEELKKRAHYTITGKPDNDAARRLLQMETQKKAVEQAAKKSPSNKPDFSPKKPYEPKLTPESEFEAVKPQPKPRTANKPVENTIYMKADEKGEFHQDPDQSSSPSAIKHEGDNFVVHADNVPKKFNPDRQLRPGEENRLVRQGNREVARQYQPDQYHPRPVKGLIESGEGKEVILRPKMEVKRWERPEPVPEPVPVPKKPEEDEKFEKKLEKVQLTDIDAIVESYAQRVGEKKLNERMDKSNLVTKAWFRLAEDGYYKKYFDEAKQEIMSNHNLLSQIETRWFKKSEGLPLRADATDIHYEILDKVIESFDKRLLEERSTEIKAEHINNMNVDLETGRLFADFAMGRIANRTDFDRLVEQRVVPLVPGAKSGERMFASNLFQLAEKYRGEVQERLRATGKELGPEQEAYVRKFFEKTLSLDLQLGEANRDMAQRLPGQSMKGYEKFVDLTQNGFFKGNSKVGRAIGRVVANPITYAAVGGIAGRGVAKTLGIGAAGILTFGSASAIIIGTGIGAGIYMGFRAARERRRDIARREKLAVLGQQNQETHKLDEARGLITQVEALQNKTDVLTDAEKQQVADIRAKLLLQTEQKVDLIGISKEEGERLGTKRNAETDLRATLDAFWQNRRAEFGATPAEQQSAYDRLVGMAQNRLTPEIQKVNEAVADEIRKRGLVMGVLGGAGAALMTGIMGGYVTRGVEHLHDKLFGGNWSGNKLTWIEALGDKLGVTHHNPDIFHGPITDHAPGFLHGHAELNLPQGYGAHDIVENGHHFLQLTGPDGHVVPGAEHIAIGDNGLITDAHAIAALRSHGWDIRADINHIPGQPGSGGNSPFHLDKIHRVDWHDEPGPQYSTIHGRSILYEGKQQELFLSDSGGNVHADVHMVAKNLIDNIQHKFAEFGHNPDSSVDTKLSGLETKLMEWYNHGGVAEVQSHLKINIIPTANDNLHNMGMFTDGAHNGAIDLSHLNSVLHAPGTTLHDGALGVSKMELGIDNGGDWHVLATASGHDAVVPAGTPGTLGADFFKYDMRPPLPQDIEYPFPLAGNRRETDKNAEANAKKRLEDLKPKPPITPEQGKSKPTGPDVPPVVPPVVSPGGPNNPNEPWKNPNWKRDVDEVFYGKKPPEVLPWDRAVKEGLYGEKPPQKPRAFTMDDFYDTNPRENRPANSTEQTEKLSKEKAIEALKPGLDANNLKEADVDRIARESNMSKTELLTNCLEAKGINYKPLEAEYFRASQLDRSDTNRAEALWDILDHSMDVARGKSPKKESAPKAAAKPAPKPTPGRPTPGKPMPGMPEPLPNNSSTGTNTERREPGPTPRRENKENEQADLAETLTGKFSKINVNVTGDGQNRFSAMTEGQRFNIVRNFERALKVINDKLTKAGSKGKIKLLIGDAFKVDPKKGLVARLEASEKGIITFLTQELVRQKKLPKETAPAPKGPEKAPEAKKKL